jgi:hypothetical protein
MIVNFIWGIADDCLRDVYVRGKYRDVILPMTVIRRIDAVLEPTKEAVLKMKEQLDSAKVTNQHAALCQAAGQAFYNASPFVLRDLKSRAKQQQLKVDFEAYLDGFSPNVQEILEKFKFRNQIPTMIESDILGLVIEKFTNPAINLSPNPVLDVNGDIRLPGLDNHSMGTVFEELIRRFNEENNEEAGEHFTPRDVVKLMAKLIFLPIADKIESGTYLFYNIGIATYIWVLTNRKAEDRKGKVQLIDASGWSVPLRKNLGKKNCEFSDEQISAICNLLLNPKESEQSKVFPNEAFGYHKITVERPLRLMCELSEANLKKFQQVCTEAKEEPIANVMYRVAENLGAGPHKDFNLLFDAIKTDADNNNVKLTAKRKNLIKSSLCQTDATAEPVIAKIHKPAKADNNILYGRYALAIERKTMIVEYEPDTSLRDTEQVPLLEDGGIEAFFKREVLPYVPDAWIDERKTQIGYEISFTRYFYKPVEMRPLEVIMADIKALEEETEGLLEDIVGVAE